jgi:hypothetical protein
MQVFYVVNSRSVFHAQGFRLPVASSKLAIRHGLVRGVELAAAKRVGGSAQDAAKIQ